MYDPVIFNNTFAKSPTLKDMTREGILGTSAPRPVDLATGFFHTLP